MTDSNTTELERLYDELIGMTREDRFIRLHVLEMEQRFNASPEGNGDPEKGKNLYQYVVMKLRHTICNNTVIQKLFREDRNTNRIILFVTLMALIVTEVDSYDEAAIIAVQIVDEGMSVLCGEVWDGLS